MRRVPWTDWLWARLFGGILRTVTDHTALITNLTTRMTTQEAQMATLQETIADINTATNELSDEVDRIRALVTSGDTTAVEQLTPIAARLRAIAADPNNPVPDAEPV